MAIKVVVAGCAGRMGQTISRLILEDKSLELAGAFEAPNNLNLGKDLGEVLGVPKLGIKVEDSLEKVIQAGEVIVDFTFHAASLNHIRLNAKYKKGYVLGTTGFSKEELAEIYRLAKDNFPLVQDYNMSTGVNLLVKLCEITARVLAEGYDVEILEAHHRMKKDAPSGTALKLAKAIGEVLGRTDDDYRYCRQGLIGERSAREIGIQTLRGGDIIGEHTVLFAGLGERIELTHRASSRETFARGALRAIKWVYGKAPGVYTMQDVLGLKE